MAQVPPRVLQELRGKFEEVVGRYEFARRLLIYHFSESQQRRMQRMLSEMALGDQKPSQLFHEMHRVTYDAISEQLLVDLWAARLPATIEPLVVAHQGPPSEKTAIVDAVVESQRPPVNAAAIPAAIIDGMLSKIWRELHLRLTDMEEKLRSGNRGCKSCRQRSRAPDRHRESRATEEKDV